MDRRAALFGLPVDLSPGEPWCDPCGEVLAAAQSFLDGECDPRTAAVVSTHVDLCGACGDELETYRWLKAALRRQGYLDRCLADDDEAIVRLRTYAALLTRQRHS